MIDHNYSACEAWHLSPPEDEEETTKECEECGDYFYCDEEDSDETSVCLICKKESEANL